MHWATTSKHEEAVGVDHQEGCAQKADISPQRFEKVGFPDVSLEYAYIEVLVCFTVLIDFLKKPWHVFLFEPIFGVALVFILIINFHNETGSFCYGQVIITKDVVLLGHFWARASKDELHINDLPKALITRICISSTSLKLLN